MEPAHPVRGIAAEVHRELVGLSARGMSTRAIAPSLGADFSTISRDRAQVLQPRWSVRTSPVA